MKKTPCSLLWFLFVLGLLLPGGVTAAVEYDSQIPQLAFAAQELNDALEEAGRENLKIALIVKPNESSPEAFRSRTSSKSPRYLGARALRKSSARLSASAR